MRGFTIHVQYGPVEGDFAAVSTREADTVTITIDRVALASLPARKRRYAHRNLVISELVQAGLTFIRRRQ